PKRAPRGGRPRGGPHETGGGAPSPPAGDDKASNRRHERRGRGLLLHLLQPDRQGADGAVQRSAARRPDQPDGAVLRLEPPAPAPVAQLAPQHHPRLHGRLSVERPELALPVQRRDGAGRHVVRPDGPRRGGPRRGGLRPPLLSPQTHLPPPPPFSPPPSAPPPP